MSSTNPQQQQTRYTCNDSGLRTWWHSSGEINPSSRVGNAAVRQSRRYIVQVSKTSAPTVFHNSFVYETIPRNGNGKTYSPWDDPRSDTLGKDVSDGVSIEMDNNINMAWTQFEYGENVNIKILSRDGSKLGPLDNVVIRPRSTAYSIRTSSDESLEITVPMDSNGRRFSVEFQNDLYTYRSDGDYYIDSGGSVVGDEPKNALLIFASPFLPVDKDPFSLGKNFHEMTPGPINQGNWGSSPVLYFPPGVYWMNSNQELESTTPKYGENHIKLHPNTYWVHFAPGAYVKGAIEYTTQEDFYATGHGVLSGEHYVYQANPKTYYQSQKDDYTSLRMWSHYKLNEKQNQRWFCMGPTVNAPPFNTMDFYHESKKDPPLVSVQISDYKQVGAFYMQTDGPQVYPNSNVHDVFYHANDDAIKTYYSNVSIRRLTVWKVHNDPVIQIGWKARDVKNVEINGLDIIHTRYRRSETYVPSAIIGASPIYTGEQKPDPSKSVSMKINNLTCEGPAPALLRITPLQNYDIFRISNVSFPDGLRTDLMPTEGFKDPKSAGESIIPARKVPGSENLRMNLLISNWTIGGHKVTMESFRANQLGQLNIDAAYWNQWIIE